MSSEQNAVSVTEIFNTLAPSYDERNRPLARNSENLHFLINLILADLPEDARILCVGIGTGADILALATDHPGWSFVGVDPSEAMLAVCAERLEKAGLTDRCVLVHGYAQDVTGAAAFDAVVTLFVAHFIPLEERPALYEDMNARLKPGGYLITAEICYDLNAPEFPSMLKNWQQVQKLMGATPESLSALEDTLRNRLSVISPEETERLIRDSGLSLPVRYYQAFMLSGWYAVKADA